MKFPESDKSGKGFPHPWTVQFAESFVCVNDLHPVNYKWAMTWDFQQCGMCDLQRLRPACAFWSEPLLVPWTFYDCWAIDWTSFGVSKLKRRLHRLIWVFTCQNATLLEITRHNSIVLHNTMFLVRFQPGTPQSQFQSLYHWHIEPLRSPVCRKT